MDTRLNIRSKSNFRATFKQQTLLTLAKWRREFREGKRHCIWPSFASDKVSAQQCIKSFDSKVWTQNEPLAGFNLFKTDK